jgi:hypothetical protein
LTAGPKHRLNTSGGASGSDRPNREAAKSTLAAWPAFGNVAMLTFLREEVPKNWHDYCDEVTDNFRVLAPTEFPIIG